jgi:hypothetical protein
MPHPRAVIRKDRIRAIPESFSWIDRRLLHGGHLKALQSEEILLYFFLVLVSGPEGTSFWSYKSIGKLLKLSEEDVIRATAALVAKDLIAFRYPTFQVLSLPEPQSGEPS